MDLEQTFRAVSSGLKDTLAGYLMCIKWSSSVQHGTDGVLDG